MTTAQTGTLVFKNEAGDYFLLPQKVLERGRVSAEHKADVERLLAESDDVSGHVIVETAYAVVGHVAFGAELLGKGIAKLYFEAAYGRNAPV